MTPNTLIMSNGVLYKGVRGFCETEFCVEGHRASTYAAAVGIIEIGTKTALP